MNFGLFGVALAQAADGAAAKGPSTIESFIMPLGMLVILYFFILRPQQQKMKAQQALIEGLKIGDEVVTTGGIIGRIRAVADDFVTVEVANNVAIKVQKSHVSGPAKPKADAAAATTKTPAKT